jgi:hypothetical protein
MPTLISKPPLLAVIAVVLVAVAAPAAAVAAPTGSISGTVTGAVGHLPIAGVRVCAASEEDFEYFTEICAHTGADGTYSIGGVPEDRYVVEFESAEEGLNYVYQAWDDQPDPFDGKTIKVKTADVSGIDAELVVGGTIGGIVTSYSSGAPIAGVEVCAEPESLEGVTECATTDAGGNYTVLGLTDGEYRVEFHPWETEFISQSFDGEVGILQADPVAVRLGQPTPNVDASLLEGGRIGGRVTDARTGAPIAGIDACTFATLGREYLGEECGRSNAAGRYLIRRVPAGVYTVHYFPPEAEPAGYGPRDYTGVCGNDTVAVTVAAGVLTDGIDSVLNPSGYFGYSSPPCTIVGEPLPPTPKPKPKKCGKGKKSRVVRGKRRCLTVRKHVHRKHHPG